MIFSNVHLLPIRRRLRGALPCLLALALLSAGCAHQGTIVRKEFRTLPFSHSLGIDILFRFELRDRDGTIRRQLVTPAVYASYEVGDYFNDLAAPPPPLRAPEPEEPVEIYLPILQRPLEDHGTRYRSAWLEVLKEGGSFAWYQQVPRQAGRSREEARPAAAPLEARPIAAATPANGSLFRFRAALRN